MKGITRRDLLKAGAAGTLMLGVHGHALAQQGVGPGDKFDLLIKGGEVLDPSQNLRAKRDIGIKNAVVTTLAPDIPPDRSAQTIDAQDKLVTPGLVDLHAHVYPQGSAIGLPADEIAPAMATTTYVSAGDAGANNFSAFKHFVLAQSRCRKPSFTGRCFRVNLWIPLFFQKNPAQNSISCKSSRLYRD